MTFITNILYYEYSLLRIFLKSFTTLGPSRENIFKKEFKQCRTINERMAEWKSLKHQIPLFSHSPNGKWQKTFFAPA
jgi:hypothetical protein